MSEHLREEPVVIACDGTRMIGILTRPPVALGPAVLIVVGGPQYRVGSHRQFALLARALGGAGVASLRFDVRGMGDSEGAMRSFEEIDRDLRTAVDCLTESVPGARGVVIWGLCDAASAALLYAHADRRVTGLVLLNPWVRTAEGEARAMIKNYYARRLVDPALWRQMLRGDLNWRRALGGVLSSAKTVLHPGAGSDVPEGITRQAALPDRMADGLARFEGRVLIILSGNDLTAQEFEDLTKRSPRWHGLLAAPRVSLRRIAEANHTFSTLDWRQRVESWTLEWVENPVEALLEREHD